MGAFFITKRLTVPSVGLTCKIQIWDTAGQEQFKPLAPMYYQSAAAAIVCYDPSNPKSMDTLKYWLDELHKNVPAGRIVIAMAACKCDLLHSNNNHNNPEQHTASSSTIPTNNTSKQTAAASLQEVEDLAAQMGAIFVPTSAKTNENVTELFSMVAERVLQFQKQQQKGGHSIPVTLGGGGGSSPVQQQHHRPISPSNHNHLHNNQHHHPSTPPVSTRYPQSAQVTPPPPSHASPHTTATNDQEDNPHNMSREEYLHRRNHHPETLHNSSHTNGGGRPSFVNGSPTRFQPKTSSLGMDGSPITVSQSNSMHHHKDPSSTTPPTMGGIAGFAASATMCGDADYLGCAGMPYGNGTDDDGGEAGKCVIL